MTRLANQIVSIEGAVHGWFRMPKPLSFYTAGGSGTLDTFPQNAQGMARDAVNEAIKENVSFKGFDALGEGIVTAMFVIHSGRGAEQSGSPNDIWSHKWQIPGGLKVSTQPSVMAQTYLTVPEDCLVGVCAHEWGHLAARWADYYDTGETGKSQGLGMYCLMAAGSWGEGGKSPTYPNGMLRMFHDWIDIQEVVESTKEVELRPASEGGGVIIIQNPATMTDGQYVVCEFRRKTNFDRALPDEGPRHLRRR